MNDRGQEGLEGAIAIAEAWGLGGSRKNQGRYSLGEGITGMVHSELCCTIQMHLWISGSWTM
jgi:hypothetical protein